jgi:hypothetical protein
MTIIVTIEAFRASHSASLNLRVGDQNWNLTVCWDFYRRWRIHPYFHYEPNRTAIEEDWNNRHKACCGWSPQSHCGRFEGA